RARARQDPPTARTALAVDGRDQSRPAHLPGHGPAPHPLCGTPDAHGRHGRAGDDDRDGRVLRADGGSSPVPQALVEAVATAMTTTTTSSNDLCTLLDR